VRKVIVKTGMKLLLAAILPLILATFYHEPLARLLSLSPDGEMILIYLGFFWGGIFGCLGILVTVVGLARSAGKGADVRLAPVVILLAAALFLYFYLFYTSLTSTEPPKVRPGETITI
jgi:hypothetical protein